MLSDNDHFNHIEPIDIIHDIIIDLNDYFNTRSSLTTVDFQILHNLKVYSQQIGIAINIVKTCDDDIRVFTVRHQYTPELFIMLFNTRVVKPQLRAMNYRIPIVTQGAIHDNTPRRFIVVGAWRQILKIDGE